MARRLALVLLGALAFAIALEVVLRIVPTPQATLMGRYVTPFVTTYPPGHTFRTATGWSLLNAQRHRANEHGFIPDDAFAPAPDAMALVGDSLVEQSMLPASQRLATLLREFRVGAPVFSMGIPGSSLFDYLERARFAFQELGVDTFWIVVEKADIAQSRCEVGVYTDACLATNGAVVRLPGAPRNPWRDTLARSALLQYFVGLLRLSPGRLLAALGRDAAPDPENDLDASAYTPSADRSAAPSVSDADSAVIERFIGAVTAWKDVRIGLLIDPEITSLPRVEPFGDPGLRRLSERAKAAGVPVVHPYRALAQLRTVVGLDLRVGPYDAHWNVLANCVIASEMVAALPGGQRAGVSEPQTCRTLRAGIAARPSAPMSDAPDRTPPAAN